MKQSWCIWVKPLNHRKARRRVHNYWHDLYLIYARFSGLIQLRSFGIQCRAISKVMFNLAYTRLQQHRVIQINRRFPLNVFSWNKRVMFWLYNFHWRMFVKTQYQDCNPRRRAMLVFYIYVLFITIAIFYVLRLVCAIFCAVFMSYGRSVVCV